MKTVPLALLLALPLVAAAAGAPPDPLPGRLFHSPAERAALDRAPAAVAPARISAAPPRRLPPARPPAQSERLRGFVLRSDGQDTYWISGAAPARVKR